MTNWHYYNENGDKMGPVGDQYLKRLAQEGTVTPETRVEDEDGQTILAKEVAGLTFAESVPSEANPFIDAPPVTENPFTQDLPTRPSPFAQAPPPALPADRFCTNCGNTVSEQAVACMSCGARPTGHKKFCYRCGIALLYPDQHACVQCGTGLTSNSSFGANATKAATATREKPTPAFQSMGNFASMSGENQEFVQVSDTRYGYPATGFNTSNMTRGDIAILVATVLALISFCLPWVGANVPFMGQISLSGFQVLHMGVETSQFSIHYVACAFLIVFAFGTPALMVFSGKKTPCEKHVLHYIEQGLDALRGNGIFGGLALLGGFVFVGLMFSNNDGMDEWQFRELLALTRTGEGVYLYFVACVVLFFGTISDQPSNRQQNS